MHPKPLIRATYMHVCFSCKLTFQSIVLLYLYVLPYQNNYVSVYLLNIFEVQKAYLHRRRYIVVLGVGAETKFLIRAVYAYRI